MNKLLDKVEKNYLKGSLKTKTTEIVEHLELSVVLHYNCDGMLPDSLQWIQNSAARLVTYTRLHEPISRAAFSAGLIITL